MLWLRMLLDLFCAGALGYLLLGRVSEPRTLWLLELDAHNKDLYLCLNYSKAGSSFI